MGFEMGPVPQAAFACCHFIKSLAGPLLTAGTSAFTPQPLHRLHTYNHLLYSLTPTDIFYLMNLIATKDIFYLSR